MQNTEISALLKLGLEMLHIDDPSCQLQKYLQRYIHELEIFNAAFNLVKVSDTKELIIRHILDSLAPWQFISKKIMQFTESRPFAIADIGSGAGFPGIPLACLFFTTNPTVEFSLIERMNKRCAVLENVRAVLGLRNTSILEVDAENAPANYFDLAVFRAFHPLDTNIANAIKKSIRTTGFVAAYKGKATSIFDEMQAIKHIIPKYKTIPITVPFCDAERNLVVFTK